MENIPVLSVSAQSLAEAYEKALIALHEDGIRLPTQYDKPGDPLSLDCTMNMTIIDPSSEPMIHKAFPGGIEDLREYVLEVQGLKDHWVRNINDPKDTRWEYTYHGRLQHYGKWCELKNGKSIKGGPFDIDQVEAVIKKLVASPFTRQAQMITWMPNIDLNCYDPPCLQSLWYRIVEDKNGIGWLNCNMRFRSNDAWGACFMNMFGFVQFNQEIIASEVSKRLKKEIKLGRLNWHADSFHIYGKDIETANQMLFNRLQTTSFDERVYLFSDPVINEIYREADSAILEKVKRFDIALKEKAK